MRFVFALALGACLAPLAAGAENVDPESVEFGEADVVIMGEVHDNPAHHLNQADWIRRLGAKAVVFEMLSVDDAARGEAVRGAGPDEVETATGWAESGWPDFAIYAPIFEAASAAAWFGGDVPREDLRRAIDAGAALALGDSASLFGLTSPLPAAERAEREANQATSHCNALPPEALPGMVEAQRLRDAALARAVVAAYRTVGGPVAVITGNGHARTDWGMPPMVHMALPEAEVLSIGQIEGEPDGDPPHDFWVIGTAPTGRGDPCEVFR